MYLTKARIQHFSCQSLFARREDLTGRPEGSQGERLQGRGPFSSPKAVVMKEGQASVFKISCAVLEAGVFLVMSSTRP